MGQENDRMVPERIQKRKRKAEKKMEGWDRRKGWKDLDEASVWLDGVEEVVDAICQQWHDRLMMMMMIMMMIVQWVDQRTVPWNIFRDHCKMDVTIDEEITLTHKLIKSQEGTKVALKNRMTFIFKLYYLFFYCCFADKLVSFLMFLLLHMYATLHSKE